MQGNAESMRGGTSFAAEIIPQLESFARRLAPPAVRALHLPAASVAGTRAGEFCALELEDGSIGLTYVLLDDTLAALGATRLAALAGADTLALARKYRDGHGVERVLGFAAVNALSTCLYRRSGFRPNASADSVGLLAPQANDHIGMIGLFTPLAQRIVASGARLTVIELKAALAGAAEGYTVTLDTEALHSCNKILATSTLLLNDTLERMLAACCGAARFALIGPGAGCLPDALFARGVSVVGGTWVTDAAGLIAALRDGSPWTGCTEKCALVREEYPGFDRLLERI